MTTATYHPTTGFGQDVLSQPLQPQPGGSPLYAGGQFAQAYAQQPFGPFGVQGFGAQQVQPQQYASAQPWTQQLAQPWTQQAGQQPFGSPTGVQILMLLPALIAQQAQQLYAIAQLCAQQVPTPAPQFIPQFGLAQSGLAQSGQRQYQMGY